MNPDSSPSGDPKRILIVEDEAVIALDMAEHLRAAGYEVVGIAASGERAIELAAETKPDLIMMDIVIKGVMDGVDAARVIHERSDVPIIFLTAYGDKETLDRAKLVGPSSYLLKPFRPSALRTSVEVSLYNHNLKRLFREQLEGALRDGTSELEMSKRDAERAGMAKRAFLQLMSHELRTPLTTILGYSELLAEDDLSEEQAAYVGSIRKAGAQMTTLVTNLLDLTQLTTGSASLETKPVDLAMAISSAEQRVLPLLPRRNIKLVIDRTFAPRVKADEARLIQVLVNLLSNAIQYNRKDGEVRLGCARVSDGRVRVAIRDTGRGIASALRSRVFLPFERIGGEWAGEDGAGIGLALSKRLMELMGGEIGFESALDEGSTFWVALLIAEP